MKSKCLRVLSYLVVALLSSALTLGAVVLLHSDSYSKLEQLENLIATYFIGDEDVQAMEDAAADAIISALGDRWSYYMTQEEYAAYKEQMANAYVGIGVTVQEREDDRGLDVTQVSEGSSAKEVGILPGDRIAAVDGTALDGLDLDTVRNMIRGTAGTSVEITVDRDGTAYVFTVERRQIQTPVATATMLDGNIGLVRITNFDSRCYDETMAAVNELLDQGAQKLIFDVRNNPGGYKRELVKILDDLLPEGLLFRSEYYDGSITDDSSDAQCLDIPMAVLVNEYSYSAAEFFAAALRDYEWAVIIGNQTCGKGYFQNTFELKDGSAVALSVGRYFTPKGVSLAEAGGLTPDIVVEVTQDEYAAIYAGTLEPMQDPQILAAIQALQ